MLLPCYASARHLPGFFLQQARQARAKAVAQGTILRLDVKDFNL
ncbi:hypothetical protein ESA_03259 [Cronobacter sakazakii ATCC BAA-894]|uniref:Uncharacterized protein n=1 Tax=Cronobacter sakazakii (strain ATCC BAA-894) TaxID=290339 RepID=A7MIE4_CROS8|nr:hypothetical protein ESA_03259 [Cronobacter sakazakii ATCC BAA-894]